MVPGRGVPGQQRASRQGALVAGRGPGGGGWGGGGSLLHAPWGSPHLRRRPAYSPFGHPGNSKLPARTEPGPIPGRARPRGGPEGGLPMVGVRGHFRPGRPG